MTEKEIEPGDWKKLFALLNKIRPQTVGEFKDNLSIAECIEVFENIKIKDKALDTIITRQIPRWVAEERYDRWQHLEKHSTHTTEICKEFREHFRKSNIDVAKFQEDLHNILQCTFHKQNTLMLYGDIDNGKSILAQAITEKFQCFRGTLSGCQGEHYFDDLVQKSIALFEEIWITPPVADDYKSILSGYAIAFNQKFEKRRAKLHRTPCILTSQYCALGRQYLPTGDEYALDRRVIKYHLTNKLELSRTVTTNEIRGFLTCNNYECFADMATPGSIIDMRRPKMPIVPMEAQERIRHRIKSRRLACAVVVSSTPPSNITANVPLLDKNGAQIRGGKEGQYIKTKKINAAMEFRKPTMEDLFRLETIKFSTDKEKYAVLTEKQKKEVDSLKRFLNGKEGKKLKALLFYHSVNFMQLGSEFCKECPAIPHYHVIVDVETEGNAAPARASPMRNFRQEQNSLPSVNEFQRNCKLQSIRHNAKYLEYLNDGHLLYMGGTDPALLQDLRVSSQFTQDYLPAEGILQDTTAEEDDEVNLEAQEESEFDKEFEGLADPEAPKRHRTADDFDIEEEGLPKKPRQGMHNDERMYCNYAQPRREAERDVLLKHTVKFLRKNKSIRTFSQFQKTFIDGDYEYNTTTDYIANRYASQTGKFAFNCAKDIIAKEDAEIKIELKIKDNIDTQDCSSIETTYEAIKKWMLYQGIDFWEFWLKLYMVMYQKLKKVNTFCLQGESNALKTVLLHTGIEGAFENVINISYSSEPKFTWEIPADENSSVVIVNEYETAPRYLSRDKNIFEGVKTTVNRKGVPEIPFARRPILLTTNSTPWHKLKEVDSKALKNRMFYFGNLKEIQKETLNDWFKGEKLNAKFYEKIFRFLEQMVTKEMIENYEHDNYETELEEIMPDNMTDFFENYVTDIFS